MRGRVDLSFAIGMLRRSAALLLFPIVSVLVVGVVSLVLLVPFGLQLIRDAEAGIELGRIGPFTITLLGICLIADAFVVVFFNGALVSEALVVVRGGHASVGHGLAVAARRAPQILAWGLVTATVGLVLSALRDRGGIGGVLLSFIGGLAWGIATVFVLPVVIVEGLYPIGAMKRSVAILRSFFGPHAALGGMRKAWGHGIGYLDVVFGGVVPVFGIVASALGAMVSAVLYVYAWTTRPRPEVDGVVLRSGFAVR